MKPINNLDVSFSRNIGLYMYTSENHHENNFIQEVKFILHPTLPLESYFYPEELKDISHQLNKIMRFYNRCSLDYELLFIVSLDFSIDDPRNIIDVMTIEVANQFVEDGKITFKSLCTFEKDNEEVYNKFLHFILNTNANIKNWISAVRAYAYNIYLVTYNKYIHNSYNKYLPNSYSFSIQNIDEWYIININWINNPKRTHLYVSQERHPRPNIIYLDMKDK